MLLRLRCWGLISSFVFFNLLAITTHAEESEWLANWHRFRGPEGTGVAPLAKPPIEWGEEKNVKWKVEVPGRGNASPIVWGDRIFLLTAIKTDRTSLAAKQGSSSYMKLTVDSTRKIPSKLVQETLEKTDRPRGRRGGPGRFGRGAGTSPTNVHLFVVMCLDRNSGKTLWEKTACEVIPHEGHHRTSSYASASPVTDGKNLYVSFGSRGIYSYDMNGNFRWKKELGTMRTRNGFGEGASPALFGDTLVVNWDQEDQSFIVALDTNTGDIRWKKDRDEASSWTTPFIVDQAGFVQVLVNGTNRIRSYDLASGKLIWECGGQVFNPVATPVVYGDLAIFMTGRRGYALQAISLLSRGDVTGTDKVVWSRDDGTPYVPSPVLVGEHLYFTKSNKAILTCVSAKTGESLYANQRISGLDMIYASHVAANGHVYLSDRGGNTVVLKDGPEMEIVATNTLGEAIDATPAIVGKDIFIRGDKHLFCIAE